MKICKAPWNHIQINSEGTINPCCMFFPTNYKKTYNSLQEAFDGPENALLRQQMLDGKTIDGCSKCDLYDKIGLEPLRNYFDHYEIENPKIRELEYSFDNTCNFKCVTCNSRFSSKWLKDDIELHKLGISRPISKAVEQKKAYISFHEKMKQIDFSELQYLKLLGGEPFINEKYLELLQSIDLSNVTVMITTNNSVFPKKWIDVLLRCKRLRLMISIDGIDEVGEFVRYGMKQKKFTSNLRFWKDVSDNNDNVELSFNYVFNILNSFNLNKTLEYVKKEKIDGEFIVDYLTGPDYLNAQFLPDNIKKNIEIHISKYKKNHEIVSFLKNKNFSDKIMKNFLMYCNFLENRMQLPKECEEIYNEIIKKS